MISNRIQVSTGLGTKEKKEKKRLAPVGVELAMQDSKTAVLSARLRGQKQKKRRKA
ncbi:hypothetical protein CAEBREN_30151 [Caenorhabditis brenneri]|uniref:Uncharacterized protein n=1 Tax=Caenorhabditis brenneri TaxID=135651 RepID=G0P1Y6_CAEBE|nr:hypothetical protein CAEBREN_30151 [Caenorhabditis brenneri]